MQNGPAENIKTPDKPKEHHSLGTNALGTIKPHHKHKHKKKEAKKEGAEEASVVGTVVKTESKKKHHHHKTHEVKDKKHHRRHHHHRQQESITQPQQEPDIVLKPQTPPPSLAPLALSTVSAERNILKAMETKVPDNAIPKTTSCEKCPPLPPTKKVTLSEWAQEYLPGVRLAMPLFALHRQAGQDWVKDVEKVFSRVNTLENKTQDAVNEYKAKLKPRSK